MLTAHLKSALKWSYYKVHPPQLAQHTHLYGAYIFHTEHVYDKEKFDRFVDFCTYYRERSGVPLICTIMTGVNARVAEGMKKHGCSMAEYVSRAKRLEEITTLGYHGHYWIDPLCHHQAHQEMRNQVFHLSSYQQQVEEDLNWFDQFGLSHNGLYAAGWWFTHKEVYSTLLRSGFRADFSSSLIPWFSSPFSKRLMEQAQAPYADPFVVQSQDHAVICVQNLLGMPTSPFPQDTLRLFNKFGLSNQSLGIGVFNAHDFDVVDLRFHRGLDWLLDQSQIQLCHVDELLTRSKEKNLPQVTLESLA